MKWNDLKETIGKSAPILGSLLGPAGGMVGTLISSILDVDNNPTAVSKALKANPDLLYKLKAAEEENKYELQKMLIQQEMNTLSEVNKTIRAELKSDDKYKSYWRPTFGYVGAIAWLLQTLVIVGMLIYAGAYSSQEQARVIMEGITNIVSSLTPQWAILLSVLGISVHQRSKDKQTAAGIPTKSVLNNLLK